MKLQINLADTFDFVECCELTINNKSYIQPYNPDRDALVFSFDGDLKPFLNFTKGYHRAVVKRPYFIRTPRLINEIRKLMRPYRHLGGRVFIDRKRAYYVDRDRDEHHLCHVAWPEGIDIVAVVKKLRPQARATFVVPITRTTNRPQLKR